MKIAIVGTGIAGNVAAYRLRQEHDITVFEAADYVGGHTNTVDVDQGGATLAIDTGFIVCNDHTYPNFLALLDEIGQPIKRSVMSFSVRSERSGLEYNGSSLDGLFAQRRNLLRPSFLRMVREILRFNREAVADLEREPTHVTIGDYLRRGGYSDAFMSDYLGPMVAAIWSAEPVRVPDMPLHFLVRFFRNHGLLQLKDRPVWHAIEGGSREYVARLVRSHRDRIRLSTAVHSIRRFADHVMVQAEGCEPERFDCVFIACHSDQALVMLDDPTTLESEVLGAIPYQDNEAVLHTDVSLMPRRQRAWAAWNYHVPAAAHDHVSVTYSMNILQGLDVPKQYCVTLNNTAAIDPDKILYQTQYQHPVYTLETIAAQARHRQINQGTRTFYCGAYWRNGFHEDGVVSAQDALGHFDEELRHAELHFRRAS